jgi:hypothetical protein
MYALPVDLDPGVADRFTIYVVASDKDEEGRHCLVGLVLAM